MILKKYYDANGYLVGVSAGDITDDAREIPADYEERFGAIYDLLRTAPQKLVA